MSTQVVPNRDKNRYSKENQPSPEAKSKGWEKYRLKKAIKETFYDFADMSLHELQKISEDMKANPDKWSVIQAKTVEYLLDGKLKVDFMNRGLPYAPTHIEEKSDQTLTIEHRTITDNEDTTTG